MALVSKEKVNDAYAMIGAINSPIRRKIILFLQKKGSATVTDIIVHMNDFVQSVISQHLSVLRKAQVVETKRNGKYVLYSVREDKLDRLEQFIDDLTK